MKQKRLKNNGYVSEDTKEIRTLVIITFVIAVIGVGLYFFTDKVINKDKGTSTPTTVEIDYNICTVGTMFNRPEDEYYVFLFDSTSDENSQYQTLLSNYRGKDGSAKVYYADLSNKFNSPYVSDKANTKPSNASEVKVNKSALVLIKNGKVSKYYEGTSEYEKVLN